jgi:hypothetical protein
MFSVLRTVPLLVEPKETGRGLLPAEAPGIFVYDLLVGLQERFFRFIKPPLSGQGFAEVAPDGKPPIVIDRPLGFGDGQSLAE